MTTKEDKVCRSTHFGGFTSWFYYSHHNPSTHTCHFLPINLHYLRIVRIFVEGSKCYMKERVYVLLSPLKLGFPWTDCLQLDFSCCKNTLWSKVNYHQFMRLNLWGFDGVITLIKNNLNWYKRCRLISIFHPWLVLILHSDSQDIHMENLLYPL